MRPTNEEKITMAIAARDFKALDEISDDDAIPYLLMHAGRAQYSIFARDLLQVSALVFLRRIKISKLYRRMKDMNWDKFCERVVGVSRRKIDEDIQNLEQFGEAHLQSLKAVGLGYRDLRALRALPEGALQFDSDGFVEIQGEKFKLTPDNSEEIKSAVDRIQDQARAKVQEAQAAAAESEASLKAARELIADKEIAIRRLTKQLQKKKLDGPEDLAMEIDNIYMFFKAGINSLLDFPWDDLYGHKEMTFRFRSLIEDVFMNVSRWIHELDRRCPEAEEKIDLQAIVDWETRHEELIESCKKQIKEQKEIQKQQKAAQVT